MLSLLPPFGSSRALGWISMHSYTCRRAVLQTLLRVGYTCTTTDVAVGASTVETLYVSTQPPYPSSHCHTSRAFLVEHTRMCGLCARVICLSALFAVHVFSFVRCLHAFRVRFCCGPLTHALTCDNQTVGIEFFWYFLQNKRNRC